MTVLATRGRGAHPCLLSSVQSPMVSCGLLALDRSITVTLKTLGTWTSHEWVQCRPLLINRKLRSSHVSFEGNSHKPHPNRCRRVVPALLDRHYEPSPKPNRFPAVLRWPWRRCLQRNSLSRICTTELEKDVLSLNDEFPVPKTN